jgi:hypothetical protein
VLQLAGSINAAALIQILEGAGPSNVPVLADARAAFEKSLQRILDLLHEVQKKPGEGPGDFAKIGLLCFCVNDMLAAFHLGQHSFANQAYSHIRSIYEHLDKIELFHRNPEWAALWSSARPEDERKIRDELSPAAVRQKLGRPRYDPLYGWFSELGAHGTFNAVRSFSAKTRDGQPPERPKLRFWIGGCPFEHNAVFISSSLLLAASMVVDMISVAYGARLSEAELGQVSVDTWRELKEFLLKHFVDYAKRQGLETDTLMKSIEDFGAS